MHTWLAMASTRVSGTVPSSDDMDPRRWLAGGQSQYLTYLTFPYDAYSTWPLVMEILRAFGRWQCPALAFLECAIDQVHCPTIHPTSSTAYETLESTCIHVVYGWNLGSIGDIFEVLHSQAA